MALLGTAVLAAAGLRLQSVRSSGPGLDAGIAAIVAASLIWLPATRRWSARAHLCWASSVFLFVVYLTYALD
jgi:hypothetical protein